jgi:tetratricopeptide (TPR) repeat protein
LKLNKLDEFGYREFSETALDLAGKMIAANAKSAKMSRALLQRVSIRDNSGDHASYLKLADSLRAQGLYNDAIAEYSRLTPIVMKAPNSPYKEVLRIWPIYCYVKLYEQYSKAAAKDKRYQAYASKYFNTALQTLKKIDESPPARQSGEYSLYKLVRALIRVQYARRYEAAGDELKSAEYYRESVLEVTEGIISARVGLDWLPESLMMAGDAYEKLELMDAARNVYKQVNIFYKSSKWEILSQKKLDGLPPA